MLNRRRSIEEAVQSVGSETYTNIEHIDADGGSSDGTQECLASVASERLRRMPGTRGGPVVDDPVSLARNGLRSRL